MIRRLREDLADNPMLFKDVTQWLRDRSFVYVFSLLLVLAEAALVFSLFIHDSAEDAGLVLFGLVATVLCLFVFILSFSGHGRARNEMRSGTFDLVQMSGLPAEKLLLGKVLALLAEYVYGLFCLVPFLFVAFLVGGVGFLGIFSSLLFITLCALPGFLWAICLSVPYRRRNLGPVGSLLLLLYFFPALPFCISLGYAIGILPLSELLDGLLSLRIGAWIVSPVFLIFYFGGLALVFFIFSSALKPTDMNYRVHYRPAAVPEMKGGAV